MPCLARVSIDTDNDTGTDMDTLPRKTLAGGSTPSTGISDSVTVTELRYISPFLTTRDPFQSLRVGTTNTDLESGHFCHSPALRCGASHCPPRPFQRHSGRHHQPQSEKGCVRSWVLSTHQNQARGAHVANRPMGTKQKKDRYRKNTAIFRPSMSLT